MTAYPLVVADSATMLRRNLRRMRRYPSLTFFVAGIPVIFLLLFVFVLGGTLGAGLGGVAGGRAEYTAYVLPGILLVTVAGAAQGTALSIAMDMTEGIVDRFKTMAIGRTSVLTGHVIGSVIQTLLALAIVMIVALVIGFRPTTGPADPQTSVAIAEVRDVLPANVYVTGLTALTDDLNVQLADTLPLFMGAVLLASFLLLMLVFRSVVVPLKAV